MTNDKTATNIRITYDDGSIKDVQKGAGHYVLCSATVKNANVAYVTVLKFGRDEKMIPSEDALFIVQLTDEEFKAKYHAGAVEVVKALHNKIELNEIGYHELWNGWILGDPFEMAKALRDNNIRAIGYCVLQFPKTSFLGLVLDIGICCEASDGEKFWCHATSEMVPDICDRYSFLLEEDENAN